MEDLEEKEPSTTIKVAAAAAARAPVAAAEETKTTTNNVKKKRKLLHHHNDELKSTTCISSHRQTAIQNTETELIKAKQRVVELENVLQRLRIRELDDDDDENNNMAERKKEKEEEGDHHDDNKKMNNNEDVNEEDSSSLLVLHGQALQLTLEFLHPKDVLTCVQVCHRWKHDIDSNQLIWRNVAQNLSSPEFIKALEEKRDDWNWNDDSDDDDSNESSDIVDENESNNNNQLQSSSPPASKSSAKNNKDTTTTSPPKDYKKVVLGLMRKSTKNNDTEVSVDPKYVPKLHPKDVFVYIEIIDSNSGNVIEFRYKNLVDMINFTSSSTRNGEPIFKFWINARNNILLPTKLDVGRFRDHFIDEDTDMLSPNFVPSYIFNSISFRLRFIRGDTGHSYFCANLDGGYHADHGFITVESDRIRPEAKSEAGIVARDMWWVRKYIGMYTEIRYRIVPDHGDQEGYSIHNWRETKYRIAGMNFRVKVDRSPFSSSDDNDNDDLEYEGFPNMLDLILSIEGLAWQ